MFKNKWWENWECDRGYSEVLAVLEVDGIEVEAYVDICADEMTGLSDETNPPYPTFGKHRLEEVIKERPEKIADFYIDEDDSEYFKDDEGKDIIELEAGINWAVSLEREQTIACFRSGKCKIRYTYE